MSESIRRLYNPQRDDIYRLATSIKGKSPMYLSPIVDTRQAVEDLLSKWFESRTTVGEKEYMLHLIIERTITLDEEIIPVKEKVKVKKEKKIKKEIKKEIKEERISTPISQADDSTVQSDICTQSERSSEAVQESRKRTASESSLISAEIPYRTRRRHVIDEEDMDRIQQYGPF
ncbi:hypothetical protein BBP40_005341, partial [Aspergillus hancockii]